MYEVANAEAQMMQQTMQLFDEHSGNGGIDTQESWITQCLFGIIRLICFLRMQGSSCKFKLSKCLCSFILLCFLSDFLKRTLIQIFLLGYFDRLATCYMLLDSGACC